MIPFNIEDLCLTKRFLISSYRKIPQKTASGFYVIDKFKYSLPPREGEGEMMPRQFLVPQRLH